MTGKRRRAMKRRWFDLRLPALALALLLLCAPGRGEDWTAEREIHCREHRPGCRLLQMVMMGSFDAALPEDAVTQRVLASAYPRLAAVEEGDIRHFCGEFGEDGDAVRRRYYGALASCLRADIAADALPEAQLDPARRVLLLFLDPSDDPEDAALRAQIRAEMTDPALERIARAIDAPEAFVRWCVYEATAQP